MTRAMSIPCYQVDAFTDRPFAGNPAAVCLLGEPVTDTWMQSVAAEMNLAETAFLVEKDDGFDLRWFTPTVEVDLCGHATLASAQVLWETGRIRLDELARFHNPNTLKRSEAEQVIIVGDNYFRPGFHCTFENAIISFVA